MQYNSFSFIGDKIRNLGTAVMHCHSNQVLRIRSAVIDTIHVDETGNVWFHIDKPEQSVNEFDREFLVGLNYFRKGSPYYINVLGVARIMIEPEEIAQSLEALERDIEPPSGKMLVKVRISNVNYYGNDAESGNSFVDRIKNTIMHWFMPHGYNYKNLYGEGSNHYA